MTIKDIYDALTDAGFNTFYGVAPKGTKCPFVVFAQVEHPNVIADNKTYFKATESELTLVESQAHDFGLQASLEEVLDGLEIPYTMSESWLPSENVIETYYTIAVYGGIVDSNES